MSDPLFINRRGKVKVSSNDTTASHLEDKIVCTDSSLTLTTNNDGSDEQMDLSVPTVCKVKVSSNDTTPNYLENKLVDSSEIDISVANEGANENLSASLKTTTVIANTYTAATITVDSKGRLTAASSTASLPPSGSAGGDLSGTYPNPSVAKITTTTGPTSLTISTIGNSEYLKRDAGNNIVSTPLTYIDTINCGNVAVDTTGTANVVAQFELDPSYYGSSIVIDFRAVAAVGNPPRPGYVRLYNLTDADIIYTFTFVSGSPVLQTQTLTVGLGAGQIDNSSKLYEVQIWVDTPAIPSDFISLGSAQLRITKTL